MNSFPHSTNNSELNVIKTFGSQALDANLSTRVGRPPDSLDKEIALWADIHTKLRLGSGLRVLDVGCGCGHIARNWEKMVREEGVVAVLVDIAPVIDQCALDLDLKSLPHGSLSLRAGFFPKALDEERLAIKYDRILCYSVLHYCEDPALLIHQAYELLAPGGRLLIGDIPNLSRKGRFLSTKYGHAFNALYKNVPASSLPRFINHQSYTEDYMKSTPKPYLNDEFLESQIHKYREAGADAFILEQPQQLVYSLTREDLLIVKPHE